MSKGQPKEASAARNPAPEPGISGTSGRASFLAWSMSALVRCSLVFSLWLPGAIAVDPAYIAELFTKYVLVGALLGSLNLLLWVVDLRVEPRAGSFKRAAVSFLLPFALSGLVVVLVSLCKLHFAGSAFKVIIFAITARALVHLTLRRKLYVVYSVLAVCLYTLYALVGFQMLGENVTWQSLTFAAALGAEAALITLARLMEVHGSKDMKFPLVLYSILFCLSPTLIAALVWMGQLGRNFLVVFATIPLAASLARELRTAADLPQRLVLRTAGIAALFTAAIVAVGHFAPRY